MEIVLLILKIIGIILLVLLGMILLLALLVVFFPISYRISASYEETVSAKLKVHWLFHLISVTLNYGEDKKQCILRILGIPLMDFLNPKPKKEKKRKPKRKKKKKAKSSQPQVRQEKVKDMQETRAESKGISDRMDDIKPEESTNPEPVIGRDEEKKENKFKAAWEKFIHFPAKIKKMLESILKKIKDLWNRGVDLKEKLDKWIEILRRERTKTALNKVKHHITGLLKHVLPRKWNAYVNFGFDDPATTGQILGYYWMLIGLWGEHFICVPDFEHKVFSGYINAKGHIQVFKFLYIAYKFMFDKDLVYLRKIYSEVNS